MVNYDVINGTDAALATGGSTAPARGIQVSVALSDANLATLGGLADVAVMLTASSQLNKRNVALVMLDNARDVRKGWKRV